jgi:hypothetical protein
MMNQKAIILIIYASNALMAFFLLTIIPTDARPSTHEQRHGQEVLAYVQYTFSR